MPAIALILSVVAFFGLFVLRSVVQWWHTGSTGIKGFDGNFGSVPWLSGVATSLGVDETERTPRVHPESYRPYAASVGRFVPRLGLLVGG